LVPRSYSTVQSSVIILMPHVICSYIVMTTLVQRVWKPLTFSYIVICSTMLSV